MPPTPDHDAPCWILKLSDSSAKVQRWLLRLADLYYDVVYYLSSQLLSADAV